MTLRHHLEYAGLAGLAVVLRALPRSVALEIGAAIGQLGWWLRVRRRLVLGNLAQALPGATRTQLRRTGSRAARNFGRVVAEFVRFAGADRRRLARIVSITGVEELRETARRGEGAIVVTGHLGSWALYVTALAAAGVPAELLVGKQHNDKVDAFILGIPGDAVAFISKGRSAPREILRALAAHRVVVLVADQDAGSHGAMVPFLGRVASTLPLPGAISARHGTPVFVMIGRRTAHGVHQVDVSPLPPIPPGPEAETRVAITRACNEALGRAIQAFPDQYFWYHRRWRDYGPPDPEDSPSS